MSHVNVCQIGSRFQEYTLLRGTPRSQLYPDERECASLPEPGRREAPDQILPLAEQHARTSGPELVIGSGGRERKSKTTWQEVASVDIA